MASQLRRRDHLRLWLVLGFVLILLQTALIGCSDDPTAPNPSPGSWQNIGPSAEFANVRELVIWNGLLVAGGTFIQEHLASSLLTWDGATWRRLEPPNSEVNALAVYDGHLIVGCSAYQPTVTPAYASQASPDTLPTIAAWDGVQWTPFDSGPSRKTITALALFEGDLVAAVVLEQNVEGYVSDVERWNGVSWQAVGGTLNGYINALSEYQGQLVAGGSFDTAGGVSTQGIAAWNGAAWTPLGSGIGGGSSPGTVKALTVDGTTLLAGGKFLTAGGSPAVNVAQWSGTAWDSLPGLDHPDGSVFVGALTMYEEMPVAGGLFPVTVNPVRTWSGSAWVPLSPLDGMAVSFAVYNGTLIAGGHFSKGASAVARWIPPSPG